MVARLPTFILALAILASGCAPLPLLRDIGASFNRELDTPKNATNAKVYPPPREDYFIGLALSGGGSRAANFSASVMWELHRLGILKHVQYISSVSGSSLPAAYYALFKNLSDKWNKPELKKTMSQCFECRLAYYLLPPWRLAQFLGTSYDRSDVMSRVFADHVFDGLTFAHLPDDIPRLIINATNYITGEGFTFTNDNFDQIHSDLRALPVADAVMASAAYPGGFRNVTLKNFAESRKEKPLYVHLFDGGISDNLGMHSLLQVHEELVKRLNAQGKNPFPKGCFLILVDSYTPYLENEAREEPDTRTYWDLAIDTNFRNAFSIFLHTKRRKALAALGFDESNWRDAAKEVPGESNDLRPVGLVDDLKAESVTHQRHETLAEFAEQQLVQRKRAECSMWHIAITDIGLAKIDPPGNLPPLPELYQEEYQRRHEARLEMSYEDFSKTILSIPTRFFIWPGDKFRLYAAGELLVHEPNSTRIACRWLEQVTGNRCEIIPK